MMPRSRGLSGDLRAALGAETACAGLRGLLVLRLALRVAGEPAYGEIGEGAIRSGPRQGEPVDRGGHTQAPVHQSAVARATASRRVPVSVSRCLVLLMS